MTNLDVPFSEKKRYIAPAPGKKVDDLETVHAQFTNIARLGLTEFSIQDIVVTGDTAVVNFSVSSQLGVTELSAAAVRNHDEKVWQINQEALCDAAALININCP